MQENSRRCSYCHFVGHTKRTCLVFRAGQRKDTQAPPSLPQYEKPVQPSASITVRSFDPPRASPHVVNLRKDDESAWDQVEPYVETPARAHPVRATMQFGALVHASRPTKDESPAEEPQDEKEPSLLEHCAGQYKKLCQTLRLWQAKEYRGAAIAIVLVLILPLPSIAYYGRVKTGSERIVAESTDGFLALQSSTFAAMQSDIPAAQADLTRALGSFAAAKEVLDKDYRFLASLFELLPIVGREIKSRRALLDAGQHLAIGNTYILKGIADANSTASLSLTDRLRTLQPHLKGAFLQYQEAMRRLRRVETKAIMVEHQKSFQEFRALFTTMVDDVGDLVNLLETIRLAFGGDSFKRYLVVFQNNHELRPTGGFMGTYAVVDIQKGKILHIDIPPGGTYDIKGQLSEYVKPPLPLQLVNGRWEFQDANWFPDFAASAEKMAWFYRHGRGATVDGVIAVNASVLERLLGVVGPIAVPSRDLVIDSETAIAAIQNVVEHGDEKAAGKPKAIIGELMAYLLEEQSETPPIDALRILIELHRALKEKEVQAYAFDADIQQALRTYGWTGEIKQTAPEQDYIALFHANLQGQKSDAKISQIIEHEAVVKEDGGIVDTLVIRRTHEGVPGEALYGVPNISYLRAYVPEGALLLGAGGFVFPQEDAFHAPESWYAEDADVALHEKEESIHADTGTRITREFGKTVFGNWVETKPGETSVAYFTYQLPFRLPMQEETETSIARVRNFFSPGAAGRFSRYQLVAQKQSGAKSRFVSRIIYPTAWLPAWKSDARMDLAQNGATMDIPFDSDLALGVLMHEQQYAAF